MLPASTFRLTEPLSALCAKGEKALGLEVVHMCRIYVFVECLTCTRIFKI